MKAILIFATIASIAIVVTWLVIEDAIESDLVPTLEADEILE
jgi:hypothetical protein